MSWSDISVLLLKELAMSSPAEDRKALSSKCFALGPSGGIVLKLKSPETEVRIAYAPLGFYD